MNSNVPPLCLESQSSSVRDIKNMLLLARKAPSAKYINPQSQADLRVSPLSFLYIEYNGQLRMVLLTLRKGGDDSESDMPSTAVVYQQSLHGKRAFQHPFLISFHCLQWFVWCQ